jgi:ribonucleotide monophosphatase NagD (HAD superfamily)
MGVTYPFRRTLTIAQAIIPMILSNEDLLGTNTEDVLNGTGSSSDDLKKTLMSKQVKHTHITVDNQAVPGTGHV